MTLGNRLYEMRKAKGLSQENAADILGVTRQTVSKWETDQSTPDFDKIIPLCELYEISTEELLTGKKQNTENYNNSNNSEYNADDKYNYCTDIPQDNTDNQDFTEKANHSRKRFAIFIAIAVCMYILSIVPLIILDGSTVSVAIFFIIIALATMIIVFGVLSKPKAENNENPKIITKQKRLYKQITGILSGITLCIYLTISFLTNDWHITWLIWVIYGIICKIIDLILTLKESDKDGKN